MRTSPSNKNLNPSNSIMTLDPTSLNKPILEKDIGTHMPKIGGNYT